MKNKKYKMHVLSHSHWDREWYQDFQGFRQRLVFQIDSLMDLLEQRPEYKFFHLDGQTICLKDYLQIRPESHDRLAHHIQNGKILIGPWFVMPDELLLSGESLVRNLMLGHKICDEFGTAPMPIGYVTDIFGHCSQFPQIVRGFGIDCVMLHRGTGNDDGTSEMVWEGADGSEVLLIKVYPDTGYCDFFVRKDAEEQVVLEYEEKKKSLASTHVLYALDGYDHAPAHWKTPESVERLNSIFKDTVCIHSSMRDYLQELKAELGDWSRAGLKRLRGELRSPMKIRIYAQLFCGTASSRVPLKQENDSLEWMLSRCAEPLHAWSVRLGGDSQKPFLDLAWQYLITNHPHDSIVGCSADQVHRDMQYRFDQARLLARDSIYESMHSINDRLDTTSLGESDAVVTVFNTSSIEFGPTVEFLFEIPSHTIAEKKKQGLSPIILDENGNKVYFEIIKTDLDVWPKPLAKKTHGDSPRFETIPEFGSPHHRFHVNVVGSIPAMGCRSWGIKFAPKESGNFPALPEHIHPVIVDEAANIIENEYLKVKIRDDALIDIYDKSTGARFTGLHDFEDCGDTGNGWNHIYPETDTIVKASDSGAKSGIKISIEQLCRLSAKATISFNMKVPAGLTGNKKSRSKRKISMPITMCLTVNAGSRRVDFETIVRNTAKWHRLRVLFPTGRKTDVWFGDSAFDLVQRNIKLLDTTGWAEQAREETPIKNFAAVQDDKAGFAVMTKGLCEACVQDAPERTLALTLFRGFEQLIGEGWTKDSLLLGDVAVSYSLVPFASGAQYGLFNEVEKYKIKPISLTTPPASGGRYASGRFLEIPDGLVISTIKTSEDGKGTIIRLFNPGVSDVSGTIKFHLPVKKAWKCDLLERKQEELRVFGERSVDIQVEAKKAATLRFE